MKKNNLLKKGGRVLLWIGIAIVLLASCLHIFFRLYMDNRIRKDLEKQFSEQVSGAYRLQIGRLKTNIFEQSVWLENFYVIPLDGRTGDQAKYKISASEIELVDFSLTSYLRHRNLDFEMLKLEEPSVTVFRNNVDTAETSGADTARKRFSTYALLKRYVHALHVEKINIENASIKIYNNEKDSLLLLDSKDNSLHIEELTIDDTADRLGRLFLAKKTDVTIRQFAFTTADSLYTIRVSKVFASYADSTVSMDSVQLKPNYSKKEFARRAGEQTDRIQMSAPVIAFKGMDVKLFFEKNWFVAKQLEIKGFELEAYRNKNDQRKVHVPRSIQALIRAVPVYVRVDAIHIKNAFCAYEEVAEGDSEPGRITFNDINGTITGLSNRYRAKTDHGVMALHASCRLMNSGKLSVYYGFPLETDKMVFDCRGHLGEMSFVELNKVLEPIANVSVQEGEVDSMIFSFHAGDAGSEGQMKLAYHDLKIRIISEDKDSPGKYRLLSFLAHALVIREQNPTRNQPLLVTRIHYTRNKERFIFNYSLKSLLSGIKPAIGIPDRKKKTD